MNELETNNKYISSNFKQIKYFTVLNVVLIKHNFFLSKKKKRYINKEQ